jgi:methionine aminopeptidase
MSITYKDADGIQGMRTACRLASEVLDHLTPLIQPGITTREIDRLETGLSPDNFARRRQNSASTPAGRRD